MSLTESAGSLSLMMCEIEESAVVCEDLEIDHVPLTRCVRQRRVLNLAAYLVSAVVCDDHVPLADIIMYITPFCSNSCSIQRLTLEKFTNFKKGMISS